MIFPIPARDFEDFEFLISEGKTQEINADDPHPKSSKPDVKTPFKRHEKIKSPLFARFELRFEKPLAGSRSQSAEEGCFNWDPNKKLKWDEPIIGPELEMAMKNFSQEKQKKTKKRIVKKPGNAPNPRIDVGGIFFLFIWPF